MVIDANMYWMPDTLFKDSRLLERFIESVPRGMEAKEAEVPETGKKQIVIFKPEGYQNLNYVDGQYDAEYQIRDMDEAGIDRAVLKLPGCQEWLPLDLCRVFNDGMAEHAEKGKGRFHALGVVPPYGTDENLKELERCVKELGMTGVQLSAHYGDRYLDDPAFRSFFRQLNDWNLPAYVHHTSLPVQFDSLLDYNNLRRSYGRCCDQITAVSREIFSGMFEELPRLKMVHSMLGGGFFSYMNLMFPKKSVKKEELDRFDSSVEPFQRALKENIYFEMSHAAPWGKVQMEAAVQIAGADHIIFGSSYPVRREWLTGGREFIESLNLSKEEKELLLSGNARKIYNLKES